MLFSTSSPPAIQRIPWPAYDDSDSGECSVKRKFVGYSTWVINEQELPWLVDPDGTYFIAWSLLNIARITFQLPS